MPIDPKIIVKRRAELQTEVRAKIDAELIKFSDGGYRPPFHIRIQEVTRTSELIDDNLFKPYRDLGWNVKYQSDQRDGDYITFEMP